MGRPLRQRPAQRRSRRLEPFGDRVRVVIGESARSGRRGRAYADAGPGEIGSDHRLLRPRRGRPRPALGCRGARPRRRRCPVRLEPFDDDGAAPSAAPPSSAPSDCPAAQEPHPHETRHHRSCSPPSSSSSSAPRCSSSSSPPDEHRRVLNSAPVNLASIVDPHPDDRVALISRGRTTSYGELRRWRGAPGRAGRPGPRARRPGRDRVPTTGTSWSRTWPCSAPAWSRPAQPAQPAAELQAELAAIGARAAIWPSARGLGPARPGKA